MAATIDDRVAELERANAQLRRQLDACSAELKEARDQQTATAEVLQAINGSPGDLAPVFDAMLEKALRLCEAAFGFLIRADRKELRPVAMRNVPEALAEYIRHSLQSDQVPLIAGAIQQGQVLHVHDLADSDGYRQRMPSRVAGVELGGVRTVLYVPLIKDGRVLGVFVIFRQEVRPFSDRQIALVQNFAAQAVIAMENARLITETREALEQRTATAEVLQVINSSPGDLAPVFDAMLEKALHLCGAAYGILWNYDGEFFEVAAQRGVPKAFLDTMSGPQRPTSPETTRGRLVAGEHVVHITNLGADLLYQSGDQHRRALVDAAGAQVVVAVSLRKDDKLLGAFTIYRQEARPFTDKQIALVTTFADQAVIAMENARLLTETREALEQQTATAEVLQVINSSPGDLAPVFDAMLDKATRLCEAEIGVLWTYHGDEMEASAVLGAPPRYDAFLRQGPRPLSPTHQRLRQGERVIQIANVPEYEGYRAGLPLARALFDLGGGRTILMVPLSKDEAALGAFAVYRQEVRPFSDKQIALLENFAAQAVIAMENARLLTETREALEQQTATAEVLQVINSSPGDLAPVFDAMLEKAMRLCEAAFGTLWTYDGDRFRSVAQRGVPGPYADYLTHNAPPASAGTGRERILRGEPFVHVADLKNEEPYRAGDPHRRAMVDLGGARTGLIVPLRKDDAVIGFVMIYRQQVRPFADNEIALLQNFAAQAVIAMENARLLTETREALEQQTATAEVLQVINSSPGDLAPVFDAMLDKAVRLCDFTFAALWTYDGTAFHPVALHGMPAAFEAYLREHTPPAFKLLHDSVGPIHFPDVMATEMPQRDPEFARVTQQLATVRTLLLVPLRNDAGLLGAFVAYRQEVRPFSDKQIALLQNFAAQAVIAMENARLITETREALEQQTATAEVLQVINSSPGDLAPVFDAMLDKALHLCDAAFGLLHTYDGERFRALAVGGVSGAEAEPLREWVADPSSVLERIVLGDRVVHIADVVDTDAYRSGVASRVKLVKLTGARTALWVALRKDDALLGVFVIYRREVRPFSDKQVALLQNFAAQAVIAMENARLLTETREALEQQTATAEVLQVINSSPGDLTPVFEAILDKARAVCGFAHGSLNVYDGEYFRTVAMHGYPEAFAEVLRQPRRTGPQARFLEGERIVHITDVAAETPASDDPVYRAAIEAGVRTVLFVPLRNDRNLLGYLTANRREARPFSEKEIVLLENFAAQAVIAMENARLLTETREALEQQTATAEVLQVINSSPGNLAPVFGAVLARSIRLCEASFGVLWTYDGERFHAAALRNVPTPYAEFLTRAPYLPEPEGAHGRLVNGESLIHIVNVADTELYRSGGPLRRALVDLGGARSAVAVALRRDAALLGMVVVYRQEVRPFSDKQIALLQNFAAQAVIAMENARLLTETREALAQQTATAEVLQVINSSPGDLAPVFDAMLEKAMRLCEAAFGTLWTIEADRFRPVAHRGVPARYAEHLDAAAVGPPVTLPHTSLSGRAFHGQSFAQVVDLADEELYRAGDPDRRALVDLGGARTGLAIPLRKDKAVVGVILIYRQEIRPFSDKQIALLQNFAAQAVIAMENARLLTETREALEQQTATAEVLQVINSSPGDLAPVFDAMLGKATTLCEAVYGHLWTYDGQRFHPVAFHGEPGFGEYIYQRGAVLAVPDSPFERILKGERCIHIPDVLKDASYDASPGFREVINAGGIRTQLTVALSKDDVLVGLFVIYRQEVRPFSDKQIALLQNFAAQAVIAMENARLITETREALEQQTATAEVLQVINSSPGDLAPVFDAMLDKAIRLCEATHGHVFTYDGDCFHPAAVSGGRPYIEWSEQVGAVRPGPSTPLGRISRGERIVHIADVREEEFYRTVPAFREQADLRGFRSGIWVALHKDDVLLLGTIIVYRQEVRPFSDRQIALLENFAAQAVIAMENARLIIETREALEQQTATAEILQVINGSPGDLAPVFDAMLQKALTLCGAAFGVLWTYDGEHVQAAALRGVPPPFAEFLTRAPHPIGPDNAHGRLLAGEPVVHIADVAEDGAYRSGDPTRRTLVEVGGGRTLLAVPLRKDSRFLGDFVIYRTEVQPFSDKQIALLQNFAAQAVIAMENARLLNELRQRTSDLQEALDYQTATSDVLKVISQSNFDLGPVLGDVIETALRLCRAHMGSIFRLKDGVYRWAVGRGLDPAYQEIEMRTPILAGPGTVVGRAALEGRAVQIADAMADPLYAVKDEASLARARTMLGVPLLREGAPIGVIAMARDRVEPFSEREIALVTTFADQAVIAIENARLFDELRERTAELGRSVEELKMLGEVGRAVSSTLDLSAVLSTILTASLGVTWATAGAIFRYIRAERAFRLVEAVGWDEALLGSVGDLNIAETETLMSEAALSRTPIQLTDLAELPRTPLRDASLVAGLRSVLIVPLVGPERIFGALVLQRREASEFPAETVRLMQTLASQSVLAIQNARLFREIADKSEQLALASEHKSQFLANMSHELRTPLNAILGYAELLVDGIYGVLPEKAQGVLERVQNNGKHLLALINDVLDLAKIEAGQLALTLEDYNLPEVVRSVVTATEPLAVAKGLKFTAVVQEGMPMAHGDARRVSQVLLNLAGNAIKFTDAGEVEINASAANGQFVLTVRDTGPGIADADQERIFGEFQQIDNSDTRKRGGTGLGLAISKRMVEMQGGMISVESTLGRGSTFRVVLPVHVEPALEEAA